MNKPKFSICMIAKNEARTLPRFINSAKTKEFQLRGGEICLLDTGSTDDTVKIARDAGFVVKVVGTKHIHELTPEQVKAINEYFVVDGEEPVVKEGQKYFNFSDARNEVASMASNDMVSFADCDEIFTSMDIDKLNGFIENGVEQFEYNFVYAHDQYGNEAIKFVQSKMYDRRKVKWTNYVHEVLQGDARRLLLDESIFKLEHYQIPSDHRSNYLPGLAIDCYDHLDYDRNSHYFAREMMYCGRPKSAIKEFIRHINMNGWKAEQAQSMIFIGDCQDMLNNGLAQVEWYNRAINTDPTRREAFIKLARYYKNHNNPQLTASYAQAAMQIPWSPFYANDVAHYQHEPHELLYWAKGWMGDIKGAQEELLNAMKYQPHNPNYLRDTKYYFEYPDQGIDGWMSFVELQFLYNTSKKMSSVCEVGSWKGRSTHAILSGCEGEVTAVDTFKGSADPYDWSHELGKQQDILAQFKENTKKFTNLTIKQGDNQEIAKTVPDKSFDMVFIDAGHTYEEVKADIRAWKSKAKICLCGHDYTKTEWMGVCRAVDEELGGPDEVHGTIWVKWLHKPRITIIVPSLRPDGLHRLIHAIKANAGYDNYEILVGADQFPPNNKGAPRIVKDLTYKATTDLVMFLGDDCIPEKDFLQLALFKMLSEFPEQDGLIGLNDGYWQGEIATHWLASKKLLAYLGGAFFNTAYLHTGCDNELTARCNKIGKYRWASKAKITHDHPLQKGWGETDAVINMVYAQDRLAKDRETLLRRSKELDFEVNWDSFRPLPNIPIPKRIITIWLNENNEMPKLVKDCIESQKIPGYAHHLITLENCFKDNAYMQECIKNKAWVKAADYLRLYYLYKDGGIYLDADVEICKGKNFDKMLNDKMFCTREDNGFVANSIIGAVKGHPLLQVCMEEMEVKFKGSDGKVFEAGMELFTDKVSHAPKSWAIHEYPVDYFLPYNHETGKTTVTDNTITHHYYMKSWKVGE